MSRRIVTAVAALAAFIVPGVAVAQRVSSTNSESSVAATAAPVAYIYVSSQPGGTGHIYGYSASQAGELTAIPGSPFTSTAQALALNGKWLFGSVINPSGNASGIINSYSIASNGSIKQTETSTANAAGQPVGLFLDHTGASLYATLYEADEYRYESFRIDQTNGRITPVSTTTGSAGGANLVFIGNNQFAYDTSCFRFTPGIDGFERRTSDGALSPLGIDPSTPSPPANDRYCPLAAAADPSNDLVISLEQIPSDGGNPEKYQLAVYTAGKNGNLSTTSTSENMVDVQVEPDSLAMSPRGVYLAVSGTNDGQAVGTSGLQVFYMHGAKPLTALSGIVLPGVYLNTMFWDNNEHLYGISPTTNKLYVFSVGTNGVEQVAGSPYSIPSPSGLIVLPK